MKGTHRVKGTEQNEHSEGDKRRKQQSGYSEGDKRREHSKVGTVKEIREGNRAKWAQ